MGEGQKSVLALVQVASLMLSTAASNLQVPQQGVTALVQGQEQETTSMA